MSDNKNWIKGATSEHPGAFGRKAKEKGIYIKMDYEKVEINEPQELIIVIPEKYEKCK